jgi:glycosyltransferase involved in cell wall biosynthesis
MRILLEQVSGGSGVDVWFHQMRAELGKLGHDVRMVLHPHAYQYLPGLARRLTRLGDWRPDVVHGTSWSAFAFRREGVPLVVTEQLVVHDPALRRYKSFAQSVFHDLWVEPFESASFRAAAAVTAVSEHTQQQLRDFFQVESTVVYNGADAAKFHPDAPPAPPPPGSRANRLKLLFAGNTTRRKGFDLLAPVLAELGDEAELWIAGGLRGKRTAGILPASSQSNIIPLGRVEPAQMPNVLAACDIFFFPTREEGLSLTAVEAMAAGKPCVTSNVTSMPELIVNGKGGYTCAVNDVSAYARAIRLLGESPRLRREFGAFNRARVLEKFTLEHMARDYERVYERVAGIHRGDAENAETEGSGSRV